ncbi:Putative aliphatic sulfonates-binding protein precursor [Candidatus Nitrosocosmicus oleophilus]|uniref:Aliphatic sulfonates-binding protein n=1 Tax=Candidatus Nitrosocosmicus oleophilus TaxID=1353260 RepID=A0A654M1X9_9ARCH|nr:ABC transporter substrate-binding protein [Candidatus Nitrosocosmicus oleophilus]ALI36603.1 Putative aliphatic sulfonates-binding protein precursor [Candidatus Nitrosocosmicus oleophilus]
MDSKLKLGISFAIIIAVIISSNYNFYWSLLLGQDNSTTGSSSQTVNAKADALKIGYFPNLNHAQAIIGLNNGDFRQIIENDKNLGNISLKGIVFTSGPSAIEALYAGQIDVAYVGPNPTINGYIVSGGDGLRVISGASSGGASFVVRNDSGIETVNDLGRKKFASPQLGNTQDVALRKYLIDNGYNTIENGGNVTVVAAKPADLINMFVNKEIDGAWVPEPLVAILKEQGDGFILVDERDLWPPEGKFVTANILARADYLEKNPEIIKKLLEAHVNETLWINQKLSNTNNSETDEKNIQELAVAFNEGLKKITGKTYPENQIKDALSRIEFTYDPLSSSLNKIAEDANDLGYINLGSGREIDLSSIYDLGLLNEVLKSKGLSPIP